MATMSGICVRCGGAGQNCVCELLRPKPAEAPEVARPESTATWGGLLGRLRREFPGHRFGFAEPRETIRPNWWRRLLGERPRLGPPIGVVAVIGPHYSIETCAKIQKVVEECRPVGVMMRVEFYGE